MAREKKRGEREKGERREREIIGVIIITLYLRLLYTYLCLFGPNIVVVYFNGFAVIVYYYCNANGLKVHNWFS